MKEGESGRAAWDGVVGGAATGADPAAGPSAAASVSGTTGVPGVADFRRALLAHFHETRRALPWRIGRTPYGVMVSEFMLQQTRVDTVVPYYERWMRRFPDWGALARADLDDVILEWKGLGYYSRARNLHRAARLVRERHGGRLPDDPEALRALPGVGEYTAGAVASIAFGRAVPAVDGNVRRVLARLLDIERPGAARLRREAARLLDPERPGDFNEAMMELGATVCTPRGPLCAECPVARWCRARAAGTVGERPARRRRARVRREEYAVAVLVDEAGRTLLARRPPEGLLAGMWEFPAVRVGRGGGGSPASAETLAEAALPLALEHLRAPGGPPVPASHLRPAEPLTPVRHAFTHLRATYRPVVVRLAPSPPGTPPPSPPAPTPRPPPSPPGDAPTTIWVHPARLDEWALPVAQQKIGALLARWLAATRPASRPRSESG